MALVIIILIATGFYIADPVTLSKGETVDKFFMGDIRFVHSLFGVLLVFLFLWRVYMAFFSRFYSDWKDFFAWMDVRSTIDHIKFYLLIKKEHPLRNCLYGPIQSLAYLALMLMVLVVAVTGLILMGANYHAGLTAIAYMILRPLENLMGGLAVVRYIHHVFTWLFILFTVVHVYMAFWHDAVLKQGTISSMVSGHLFEREKD